VASDRKDRTYIAIDLKSYYSSVECVERGLDLMTTDLVVADPERTKGTICVKSNDINFSELIEIDL